MDQMNNEFNQQPVNEVNQQPGGKGLAIASMVCGILGIVFCACYSAIGIILGIVAVALAVVSKNKNNGVMQGMAKAGLVCGIIAIVINVISIIVAAFILTSANSILNSLY